MSRPCDNVYRESSALISTYKFLQVIISQLTDIYIRNVLMEASQKIQNVFFLACYADLREKTSHFGPLCELKFSQVRVRELRFLIATCADGFVAHKSCTTLHFVHLETHKKTKYHRLIAL